MGTQRFNDLEGLRIAAQIENRGYTFYTRAMRISKSPVVLELLKRLADEEMAHSREFLRLYDEAVAQDTAHEDYDEYASELLSAFASEIVFPGGLMALGQERGFDDPAKILLQGIQSEKESILFYIEMIKQAKHEGIRNSFREIVRQEIGHLKELADELEQFV